MILHSKMAAALIALAVFLPLALPAGPAQAQQSASGAAPKISGFDVVALRELSAGNELAFTLYGSPGGTAKVQVGGATSSLLLAEVEPGVYEGTHTISKRDRITAKSTATANLRLGNRVASSVLDESLLAGAPAPWSAGTSAPSGGP